MDKHRIENEFIYEKENVCSSFSVDEIDEVDNCNFNLDIVELEHLEGRHFSKIKNRLRSYKEVWRKMYIDILDLSKAGFFYVENPDRVQCFSCKLILEDWCITDDPWEEHAFWNPKCKHVIDKKGLNFISDINKKWREYVRCQ